MGPPPAWSYTTQFFKAPYDLLEHYAKAEFTATQDYNFRYRRLSAAAKHWQ